MSALAEWGSTWHIKFEPAKSQALTISHHRSPIAVPAINVQGTVVPEVAELHLLGIMFDKDLSFRTHIRHLNIRGTQRLGFLRKAAAVLGPAGCVTAYKGFVRPVLEYGMLTWMGASQTTLRQLANVQRRALHVIGPGSFLPSLEVRRAVAALCFLYKLHYLPGPAILTQLLPPPAPLLQRETRMQLAVHHNYQLTHPQSRHSRSNVQRSFPDAIISTWIVNSLPSVVLQAFPSSRGLQTFKTRVYYHLRSTLWQWATDCL